MIRFENVSKTYRARVEEVCALKSASFALPERGMVFFVGKSGSGKTTLLNLLGGLDRPTQGRVTDNGEDIANLPDYRDKIGYVFQNICLFSFFSVEENVLFGARYADAHGVSAAEALRMVGLEGFEKRAAKTLSGGEQQRVAIARMLVKRADVLIADEPTGNLDGENARSVFEILKNLSGERLVVVVTHDRESAARYADVLYELRDGTVTLTRERQTPQTEQSVNQTIQKISRGAGMKADFRLATHFITSQKLKNALYLVALSLLLFLLCVSACFFNATEQNVIFRYLSKSDLQFAGFTYDSERQTLSVEEWNKYFEGSIYCNLSYDGESMEGVAVCRDISLFYPLAEGDAGGAVLLKEDGFSLGDSVELFGISFQVTGLIDTAACGDEQLEYLQSCYLPLSAIEDSVERITPAVAITLCETLSRGEFNGLYGEGFCATLIGTLEGEDGKTYEAYSYIHLFCDGIEDLRPFLWIFCVVAALLVLLYSVYFIGFSVSENQKSIGILQSLGAKNTNIARIFLLQCALLSVLAIAISLVFTACGMTFLNASFVSLAYDGMQAGVTFFFANGWQALCLIAGFIVNLALSLLSIVRIRKVSVSDLMKTL